jgi:phenylalanyl-tRNA synthetase alpha chain
MQSKISQYSSEIEAFEPKTAEELETFRIKFLGTKGIIKDLFDEFKAVSAEEKRILGKVLNQFKQLAEAKFNDYKDSFTSTKQDNAAFQDLTLTGEGFEIGGRHPLSLVRKEIVEIFKRLGFVVAEGPEIEDDWHNFSALNFPEEHPARDMQDTFFVEGPSPLLSSSLEGKGVQDGFLKEKEINISENKNINSASPSGQISPTSGGAYALRTHTSSVQVRLMEAGKPPFRALMPGRVYRNEAISARAHCFFHQVEGLYVDENVSFADLKQTLYYFVQELYGEDTKVRFRPSYFPFTEPSAEMDISCTICKGEGCQMCKYSGWVEILGCGMIDPNVLDNVNIDSKKYTGFAFGMGIERITNLKYQIKDLRLFSENDIRFLKQFQTEII